MSAILVVLEQNGGAWNRMSFEALAAGQQLGRETGLPVSACLLGAGLAQLASEAARYNIERVIAVESEALASYTADGATEALTPLISELAPRFVLLPHTYQTRDFAPKLATRLGGILISDSTGYRASGDGVNWLRQMFQGKLTGEFRTSGDGPVFVSLQAGAFRATALESGAARVESRQAAIDPSRIRQRPEPPYRQSEQTVDLTAAERIVAVGRGIKEEGNLVLVRELAEAMGAELAASRPVCDNGWLPMERQVGSSGQTVSPKLYVAAGISGAIQHLVGMKGSQCVVAINKDPEAPIFETADYGLVGDLFEIVPAMTEELRKPRA